MVALLLTMLSPLLSADATQRFDSLSAMTGRGTALDPALRSRVVPGMLDTLRLRDAFSVVVDSLVGEGHLLASISADSLDSVRTRAVLHVSGEAGPRFSWSPLEQEGSRLRPAALARAARWKAGADADPSRVDAALERLENTGWVKRAEPTEFVREPRSLRLRPILHLEDQPTSWAELAGGWTSGEDMVGHIQAELDNLLGTGRRLRFSIAQDDIGSDASAAWREPWIGPLDIALETGVEFHGDSLLQSTKLWADLEGAPGDGRLILSGGVGWRRHAEKSLGDTAFGDPETETSTRVGARGWIGDRDGFWPTRRLQASLTTETVALEGRLGRFRARHGMEATHPLAGPVLGQVRWGMSGLWPLEPATSLSEFASPGGLDGWHGWREGTPWTPSWAWGALELRLGSPRQGGLRAFWEPGMWWVRRPSDQEWEMRATWTAGGGLRLRAGAWEIDVLVAGERETPTWEDALVHLRARNRF